LVLVQAQSASLGVVAGICQVLLAVWQVLGPCSMLQMEAVLQSVLLRLADGEEPISYENHITKRAAGCFLLACGLCSVLQGQNKQHKALHVLETCW
jgi:hypothetical protein